MPDDKPKLCPFLKEPCIGKRCMGWTDVVLNPYAGRAVEVKEGYCKVMPGM